jgi:hypothetical protein
MADKHDSKWTRERSFLERNGPDIGIVIICCFFLVMMVLGTGFVLLKPEVPGLSNLFKEPPPPPRDPMTQKLTLEPGEQEIILFKTPGKPVPQPKVPPAKP